MRKCRARKAPPISAPPSPAFNYLLTICFDKAAQRPVLHKRHVHSGRVTGNMPNLRLLAYAPSSSKALHHFAQRGDTDHDIIHPLLIKTRIMAILSQTVSDDLKTALPRSTTCHTARRPILQNGNLYPRTIPTPENCSDRATVHAEKFWKPTTANSSAPGFRWSCTAGSWLMCNTKPRICHHQLGSPRQYTLTVGGPEFVTEQLIDTLSQQEADPKYSVKQW